MGVDTLEDADALITSQIYREWGMANMVGRARCLLKLLSRTVGGSHRGRGGVTDMDDLIERAQMSRLGALQGRFHPSLVRELGVPHR